MWNSFLVCKWFANLIFVVTCLKKFYRTDLANIVRRRGYKHIKDLLSSATKTDTNEFDVGESLTENQDATSDYEDESTGQYMFLCSYACIFILRWFQLLLITSCTFKKVRMRKRKIWWKMFHCQAKVPSWKAVSLMQISIHLSTMMSKVALENLQLIHPSRKRWQNLFRMENWIQLKVSLWINNGCVLREMVSEIVMRLSNHLKSNITMVQSWILSIQSGLLCDTDRNYYNNINPLLFTAPASSSCFLFMPLTN